MITALKNEERFVSARGNLANPRRRSQAQLRRQIQDFSQLAEIFRGALEALVATVATLEFADLPSVEFGVDFYGEIRRYEMILIERALRNSHGSQRKAAELLRLNPQTLNSKLKLYAIDASDYKRLPKGLSVIP